MQYRSFGPKGHQVSAFGMGCMRMPTVKNEDGIEKVDRPEAIRMIRRAIEGGVTYFDTAYVYHNQESESVLGEALAGGLREKVTIATKLPLGRVEHEEQLQEIFDEELRRLQTDHIDVYLLHALSRDSLEKIEKFHVGAFLDKLKAEGKIRYACFSFHDDFDTLKKLMAAYDFDMVQIQMNILDVNSQATLEGMRYIADHGLACVIMEPLRGGTLANVPAEVQALYDAMPVKRNPAEWGFRFMYNFPQVSVILSGVHTMEQLEDNLRIFDQAQPNVLTAREERLYEDVRKAYDARIAVRCTACRYCQPCPQGVLIPDIFNMWNDVAVYGQFGWSRAKYRRMAEGKATQCAECGTCEAVCPQHIEIASMLKEAHRVLTEE